MRLNLIGALPAVNALLGVELLATALLPAIEELAEDRQWRVRLAVVDCMPPLAAQLGVAFFEEKLCAMCVRWLQDCVYTIRESAIANVRKLTELFGLEWAAAHLIPKATRTRTRTPTPRHTHPPHTGCTS